MPQTVANELSSAGAKALAYRIDVGDTEQIEPMVKDVVAHFGRIDMLINNAGINRPGNLFDLKPETDWDPIMRVNQRGLFFCLQAVAKQMVEQIPDEVKQSGRAESQLRKNRQFLVGGRAQRTSLRRCLFRRQVGGHQHYSERRRVSRALQHQRQCGVSRPRADADVGHHRPRTRGRTAGASVGRMDTEVD